MSAEPIRILSLGAGVQSSTLYLMAVEGAFGDERPELAIFADTQWEPKSVYEWLEYLRVVGGHAIPIRVVTKGNIREAALTTKITASGRVNRITTIPVFLKNPNGSGGMLKRQCTRDYKIRPIRQGVQRYLKEIGRRPRPNTVEQWIGISTDEAARMKDSGVKYIVNRHPLIERNMSRGDCLKWLQRHGYPEPPKSACIGCPYTGNRRWLEMQQRPEEWADAVDFDARVRRLAEVNGEGYVHYSRKPLPVIDFAELVRRVDDEEAQVDLFQNECEGMCGV